MSRPKPSKEEINEFLNLDPKFLEDIIDNPISIENWEIQSKAQILERIASNAEKLYYKSLIGLYVLGAVSCAAAWASLNIEDPVKKGIAIATSTAIGVGAIIASTSIPERLKRNRISALATKALEFQKSFKDRGANSSLQLRPPLQ